MSDRYIDLSFLPKLKNGNINWKTSAGSEVFFVYSDDRKKEKIKGKLKINKYDNRMLDITYLNKHYQISTSHLAKCQLGGILYSKDFIYNIGDRIKDDKRDITIVDKIFIESNRKNGYKERQKSYKYICNICGWKDGTIRESQIKRGHGCSCCYGRTAVEGINTICDTDPWAINYFLGGYDEAKKYTRSSNKRISLKCPICGKIEENICIGNFIKHHGFDCKCTPKKSFPERLVESFLKNVEISYIHQLSKGTFPWCENYRYDFYLKEYNSIIEVHGEQHYKESGFGGKTLYEEQNNDECKLELALKNGISHYIIIDARKSDFNYIKTNIINNNILKDMTDMSKVCWNNIYNDIVYDCEYVKICELWNKGFSVSEIQKITCIRNNFILNSLKISAENGDTDYSHHNSLIRGAKSSSRSKNKPIICIEKNYIFDSIKTMMEMSKEIFGFNISKKSFYKFIKQNGAYKGLHFVMSSKEEFNDIKTNIPELAFGDLFIIQRKYLR